MSNYILFKASNSKNKWIKGYSTREHPFKPGVFSIPDPGVTFLCSGIRIHLYVPPDTFGTIKMDFS
jgi:hypothetical protein